MMTAYLLEKINTALAKAAECMARDPKRAERLLGDVKRWVAELAETVNKPRGASIPGAGDIAALEDLRRGVELDRHNLPDGDAKLAALDTALAVLRAAGEPVAWLQTIHGDQRVFLHTKGWTPPNAKGHQWQPLVLANAAPQASADPTRAMLEGKPLDSEFSKVLADNFDELCIRPAAEDSAKGAGDVALPPLPDLQFKMFYRSDVLAELEAYARVAVLADRQQRGRNVALPPITVSDLPARNQDENPSLSDWWVQVLDGNKIVALIHGNTPESAEARAESFADFLGRDGNVIDVEAAAKKLAECMDYPWAEMPEQGRKQMRANAQAVVSAALAATKGESNE